MVFSHNHGHGSKPEGWIGNATAAVRPMHGNFLERFGKIRATLKDSVLPAIGSKIVERRKPAIMDNAAQRTKEKPCDPSVRFPICWP